jgi:A/G-specific adenine glycosylase
LFDLPAPVDTAKGIAAVRSKLESMLPAKGGREFISALMELGALVCRAGRPDCLLCPVKEFCSARHPEKLPIKAPKKAIQARTEHAAWISDGASLLLQQSTARRWTGLWRLPPLTEARPSRPLTELAYSIVRERVTLHVYPAGHSDLGASDEPRKAFPFVDLPGVALPSPHRRAIARLLRQRHS